MKLYRFSFKSEAVWLVILNGGLALIAIFLYLVVWLFRLFNR